jgi:hypothetical protein
MFFFGAAPVVVFLTAALAAGMAAGVAGSEAAERGDLGRAVPLPLASGLRNGDAARGVPTREGGFDGRLMVGLSQEEKKSSSLSPAGVLVPSEPVPSTTSVITTSLGYLGED